MPKKGWHFCKHLFCFAISDTVLATSLFAKFTGYTRESGGGKF